MWIKILTVVLQVAKVTGLDKKVKDWVGKKLDRTMDKAEEKFDKASDKAEIIYEKVDALREKYDV